MKSAIMPFDFTLRTMASPVKPAANPRAVYACLNYDEAFCPQQIEDRSICIDGDAGDVLQALA